jgi:hypothetical protein
LQKWHFGDILRFHQSCSGKQVPETKHQTNGRGGEEMLVKKAIGLICCVCIIGLMTVPEARADVKIQKLSSVFDEFTVGMDLNLFYRVDKNPYFGAKLIPDGNSTKASTDWGNIAGRLNLTAKKDIGWTNLSAQLSPVYLGTIGQDVYGVYNDNSEVAIDRAWMKFSRLLGEPLDVKIGMQDINFEKQFLVGTARTQGSALWLPIHDSWPFAVSAHGDFGSLKTTAFWGRTYDYVAGGGGPPKGDIQGAGLNLHYDISKDKYVYGGGVAKIDNSGSSGRVEQNTQAFNLGYDLTFGGFEFEGEGAYQIGNVTLLTGKKIDRKAFGGNIRAKYTFPIKFDPYIKLSYIYLSGDKHPTNGDDKEWDPMFWGFPNWNYNVIGELVGEAQLATPNTNKKDLIVEAGFTPFMPCFVNLSYIKHKLDEKYVSLGEGGAVPVSSDDWADELDLFVDWPIHDNLVIHFGAGYVMPKDAAKEYYGSDDNATFGQLWLDFTF